MYKAAGATIVPKAEDVWGGSDILLKVRPPTIDSTTTFPDNLQSLKDHSTLISFIYASRNPDLLTHLASKKSTVLAMEMIPRISRAQVFDALSSMANLAGYKAVLEASNEFGGFLGGSITAAGKIQPAKVLVIGAGVAGLSAVATVNIYM
jgi:NAD(P) transhydrogenase